MKNVCAENNVIDQILNIDSAKALSHLLRANASDKINVPGIANALEKLLEPVGNFLERLSEESL
jgi:hypothetical protein